LGLSIVHQIVRENGGTIAVESTENSGTTFTIRLNAQETANIAVKVS
jgi:signal transduction histidine kinase